MTTEVPVSGPGQASPDPHHPAGPGVISFALVLNIFWRRARAILIITLLGLVASLAYSFLTKPLYRATAQVRPGIVSYTDYGAPVREWHLKDIVRWFRTELYWNDMQILSDYEDLKRAPVIRAEFIPQGPQYVEGGDVIMLENLSTSPERAVAILEHSIQSFNTQAASDSLGSTLHLTIGGARVRVAKLMSEQKNLDGLKAQLEHSIRMKNREIEIIAAQREQVQIDIGALAEANESRERVIASARSEITASQQRLASAEVALESFLRSESGGVAIAADAPITQLLAGVRSSEIASQANQMLLNINEMGRQVLDVQVMADTLQIGIDRTLNEIERIRLENDLELQQLQVEAEQEIGDFELQIKHDIPYQYEQFQEDINAEIVRLDLLSPLERIGKISVTNKPVRPRKLRATVILTVLAFISGLFFVLGAEYYSRNKGTIKTSTSERSTLR